MKETILLHTCCAPCLIVPYRLLSGRGLHVVAYFYNPNIQPFSEYRKRYSEVVRYCEQNRIELRVGTYDMEEHLRACAEEPANRCGRCFRMRLDATAREAERAGIERFSTTLSVSPYQEQALINEAGDMAATGRPVLFHAEDFRDGYRESITLSKDAGMYRQKYCGCVYSEKERFQKSDPPRI